MLVVAGGIVRLANFVQLLNALLPTLVTVVGIVKLAKFAQS
jgi:hypothetical protein